MAEPSSRIGIRLIFFAGVMRGDARRAMKSECPNTELGDDAGQIGFLQRELFHVGNATEPPCIS